MGHISLATPVSHVWFFKGAPSKMSLLLDISPRNLSGVIYFARYLVLKIDEAKRKVVLRGLDKKMKSVIKDLEEKAKKETVKNKVELKKQIKVLVKKIKSKEQRDLKKQALEAKAKQEILTTRDNLVSEKDTAEEIYKTVSDLVKKVGVKSVLSEDEYLRLFDYQAADFLEVGMGAESLLRLIKEVDLEKEANKLRQASRESKGQKRIKATKRLRVIEGLKKADILAVNMVLKNLPVIPPDLRPMVQLSGGRFATSDLNDLYRRVINRNNRLKHLINLGAPEIILRNEKRMLQEAVDTLIDASQSRQSQRRRGTKELRSLSEMLRGKQGRFRQNLLGKRVDYSGRSVIVAGPELKLNQCGLPKDMALEMFKPYVLRELITRGIAPNVKSAKHVMERKPPEVYDILEEITKHHPVLLNRAPTLHKLGIQAFYPVLIEGNAIRLHPCVCAGYNADFDGDQMAIHVPLSKKAQKEAIELMMPQHNLLKPADGSPITIPNKNMALGCYFVTSIDFQTKKENLSCFSCAEEANLAYQEEVIKLRQPIIVRIKGKLIETTIGRIMFNEVLPKELRFINETVKAEVLKDIIRQALKISSTKRMMKLIDDLKLLGFTGETYSGLSVAVTDCKILPEKEKIITQANQRAEEIEKNFKMGLITVEEKRRLTNEIWLETTDEIADKTWENFTHDNSVRIIIESGGTRASKDQVKQLAAMRGLTVDPLGKIVELPTKSNFREGLSVFEYVTSARGSRKGLTDSAIKTADAGYLTRRLVDVAHDMIVRHDDCGTKEGIEINRTGPRGKVFFSRLVGSVLAKPIKDPKTKKLLLKKGALVTEEDLEVLAKHKVDSVIVRSALSCDLSYGICQKCYGWDFSTKDLVTLGTPVGVIAAQSIGEPGTQLTMRVKHFGGIVMSDVTQGLPRVEELFEARTPKVLSPLSEIAGRAKVKETENGYEVTVKAVRVKPAEEKKYLVPLTSTLRVKTGELIPVGYQLASGGLDLKGVLKVKGLRLTQKYLVNEVQAVYESQGIPIHDKHLEVIIRKMSDKVRIETAGDTNLLPGELVERRRFKDENAAVLAAGGEPATAQVVILGITRASLYTDSWLSAASFQETSNVLTDVSCEGKTDYLLGLKENVIIGRLIPTSPNRAKIEQ